MSVMARTALGAAVLIGVVTAGFFAGRSYQHLKTGYFFNLQNEKEFALSPDASLRLQHATKNVGLPFLTPPSSILLLEDSRWGHITLYEAQCGFQEAGPYVEDVTVDGNEITWRDGRYSYQLKIDVLSPKAVPPTNK